MNEEEFCKYCFKPLRPRHEHNCYLTRAVYIGELAKAIECILSITYPLTSTARSEAIEYAKSLFARIQFDAGVKDK